MLPRSAILAWALAALVPLAAANAAETPAARTDTVRGPKPIGTMVVSHGGKTWKVDVNGGKQSVLTQKPWGVPSLSARGEVTLIEYTRTAETDAQPSGSIIHVLDLAGREVQRLPLPQTVVGSPARLSPDGTKIAFNTLTGGKEGFSADTHVFQRAGGALVTFRELSDPSWLPDGRLVMCGATGIVVSDLELTVWRRVRQLPAQPVQCVASNDGARMAFVMNGQVWTMAIDGSDLVQTTEFSRAGGPAWSPDDALLAVIADPGSGESENRVYLIPSNAHSAALPDGPQAGNGTVRAMDVIGWH